MNTMNSGISKALRHLVFERDSYTCVLCDEGATDAHHFVPRSRGGRNIPENLVSLCRRHHEALHKELGFPPEVLEPWQFEILQYLADYYTSDFYEWLPDSFFEDGVQLPF